MTKAEITLLCDIPKLPEHSSELGLAILKHVKCMSSAEDFKMCFGYLLKCKLAEERVFAGLWRF